MFGINTPSEFTGNTIDVRKASGAQVFSLTAAENTSFGQVAAGATLKGDPSLRLPTVLVMAVLVGSTATGSVTTAASPIMVTVSTTANSQFLSSSLGAELSLTCNRTTGPTYTVTSRAAEQ